MVLQVNLLIYAYMALCVCMLIFNIVYVSRARWHSYKNPRRVKKYREWMEICIRDPSEALVYEFKKKIWNRELKRSASLLLFEEALEQLSATENNQKKVILWMHDHRDMVYALGTTYLKKKGMEKAFYAYILEIYQLCGPQEMDPFVLQMQQLVMDHSIYCRENALCALYAGGVAGHVVKAYEILTRMDIIHSSKMVTDGLLTFRGDKEMLAEALWDSWESFSDSYRAAFINFIRMVSDKFTRRFLPILMDSEYDREVRFAILRYYRKYYYGDARDELRYLTAHWEQADWEFSALAALALECYPGAKTVEALRRGCRSRNWHVRYNCAQSLSKLLCAESMERITMDETDAYAKDMLMYNISLKEARKYDGSD